MKAGIAAAVPVLFCLGLAGALPASETFTARVLSGGGPNSERVQNIRIELDGYSTPEEIAQLAEVINAQGWEPFIAAFREQKKGVMRIMGTRGYNVPINAVHSEPTAKGRKVWLFAERQVWDADTRSINTREGYLFMVVELDLDAKGKGDGKIFHQANIKFNKNATLALDTYNSAPKLLIAVKQTK
jgi:hypothetical protein